MKPLALLLFALVVLEAAGCGWGGRAGSGPATVSGATSGDSLTAAASRKFLPGRVSDLQFVYPRRYYARSFVNCSYLVTGDSNGGCDRGVVVASYPLRSQPESGGSGARFSHNGVALELYRPPADQVLASVNLGDRRLSLWQFDPPRTDNPYSPENKPPPPEQWEAFFQVDGASYWAIAWVGTKANKSDRAALAALINSVHARGQTPRQPSPRPAPQVTRVLCGGTASNPRVPDKALAGGSGSGANHICVQIFGHTCRVWTRRFNAPPADVRERHLQLRASFCRLARRFLKHNPLGYSIPPTRPGLTALLPQSRVG